ncbi:Phosphoribosylaminoimidazole-succinocarboxamide synthase [Porphyridium purpureum]|uniref:SAICAR synthetase n=1 Tax=Porphyridium purpureum TaxID=35688 RepID=A0A5J4YYX6_PORPP|nr:Phosphoribosylaminoimidazole-succinocarboxamide synthase [Porphyridium purpureum]|eukprot:POR3916..scf209_3
MAFVFGGCSSVPVARTASSSACSVLGSERPANSPARAVARRRRGSHGVRMHCDADAYVKPVVVILMGSAADLKHCEKIAKAATALGMDAEMRIASAHKIPNRLLSVIAQYQADPRPKVYVSVAGRSNALSGMLDCAVSAPVIACPPYSDAFGGSDLFSSIRMPGGVTPMLVLDPAGAALAAAKIVGVYDSHVREKAETLQKANRDRLFVDDAQLTSKAFIESKTAEELKCITDTSGVLDVSKVAETRKGKVRDQYELSTDEDLLVLVTTDRQSAFDRLLAEIPFKGAVLNSVSNWWFQETEHIIPNHVLSVPHPNVTVARKCKPFPIEFVVRGYITGSTSTSLWKNYSSGVREYCGITFPEGLIKNQKLESNVLTPTTKGEVDRPISPADIISEGWMTQEDYDVCAKAALEVFEFGQKKAAENGLILVDTKFEFGRSADGVIRLIDEVLTPDSSRYWLATSYAERMADGKEPENIDKEFLRLWFADNCDPYNDKTLPEAPQDLVLELSRRYIMLYELITGQPFDIGEGSSVESIREALKL